MNKQTLKVYEAPKAEVIEMEAQGVLCASGGETSQGGYNITNQTFGGN